MFLACVEIAACPVDPVEAREVLEVVFDDLEPAKSWAAQQADRGDATGNAAVFETAGPLMVLAWERIERHSTQELMEEAGAHQTMYVA